MNKLFVIVLTIFISVTASADQLNLWSQCAILIDYTTEQILYQKNQNTAIQPASMTKLVTLYMAYKAINNGFVSKDDLIPISSRADYKNLPRDSSLMFIEEGQQVTLLELMKGLAIPSGNDAAIAIAEYLYGSVENYLIEVEATLQSLGFKDLTFVDSSGYSDYNSITVAQFAEFCMLFLKQNPEAIEELFSLASFTYPTAKNGPTTIGSITQFNHNQVIKIFPECDGLKTGFINISGMNISLTAKNENRRVVAVLAGVKDEDKKYAELKRIYDSIIILNHGLTDYKNINLDKIELPELQITNSPKQRIKPIIPYKREFSLLNNAEFIYSISSIEAPISYGETIGYVEIIQSGMKQRYPIISNENVRSIN